MEYGYPKGHVFYRKLARTYPLLTHGEGIYLYDEEGTLWLFIFTPPRRKPCDLSRE